MGLDVSLYRIPLCPCCEVPLTQYGDYVFESGMTHNLNEMANVCGVYKYVWLPDELGLLYAEELIEPLQNAVVELKANPAKYKKYNPENGFGDYYGFIRFLESYLKACQTYPDAQIEVSR